MATFTTVRWPGNLIRENINCNSISIDWVYFIDTACQIDIILLINYCYAASVIATGHLRHAFTRM